MGAWSGIRTSLVAFAVALVVGSCGSTELDEGGAQDGGGGSREMWTGTLEDEHRAPAVVSRSEGTIRLTVDPDGTVTGKGSATQFTEGGNGRFKIGVTGTRDGDVFHLTWTGPGGSLDVDLAIDGETAAGSWEIDAAGTVYSGTIALECRNCSASG